MKAVAFSTTIWAIFAKPSWVPTCWCLQRDTFECTDMVGNGTHHMPAGTFSDDTSMMLATCDSIRVKGGRIDVKDMRKRFFAWWRSGEYTVDGACFDIGNTTVTA